MGGYFGVLGSNPNCTVRDLNNSLVTYANLAPSLLTIAAILNTIAAILSVIAAIVSTIVTIVLKMTTVLSTIPDAFEKNDLFCTSDTLCYNQSFT